MLEPRRTNRLSLDVYKLIRPRYIKSGGEVEGGGAGGEGVIL